MNGSLRRSIQCSITYCPLEMVVGSLSINEKIAVIKANCVPLGISVQLIVQQDRYYICLTEKGGKWPNYWGGLAVVASNQVKPIFTDATLTSVSLTQATFFIGTFFDFIKGSE